MDDERQETYQRLIAAVFKLPAVRDPIVGMLVSAQDVIGLLAEEFLVERRGVSSTLIDVLSVPCPFCGAGVDQLCVNYTGATQGFTHYTRDRRARVLGNSVSD